MKPIHGEKLVHYVRFNLQSVPPVPCNYRIGEKVLYTNEFGVSFEMEVVGYSPDTSFYGRFIHLITAGTDGSGSAYWFPHTPEELTKLSN